MAETVTTKRRDPDDVRRALETWLPERLGGSTLDALRVAPPQGHGYSNDTFIVDAVVDGAPMPLVIQAAPTAEGLFPEYPIARMARIQRGPPRPRRRAGRQRPLAGGGSGDPRRRVLRDGPPGRQGAGRVAEGVPRRGVGRRGDVRAASTALAVDARLDGEPAPTRCRRPLRLPQRDPLGHGPRRRPGRRACPPVARLHRLGLGR